MRKKTLLIATILVAIINTSIAQGYLELNINPPNAQVRINKDRVLNVTNKGNIVLMPGTYPIEIWSPEMALISDTIEIKADKTTIYNKSLKEISVDYKVFQNERRAYYNHKFRSLTTVAGVVGINLVIAAISFDPWQKNQLDDIRNKALIAKSNYERSFDISEIQLYRNEYNDLKSDFEQKKSNHNLKRAIGIPVLAVGIGVGAHILLKRRKKKREIPIFKPNSPFTNIELIPNLGYDGNSMLLGTTLNF